MELLKGFTHCSYICLGAPHCSYVGMMFPPSAIELTGGHLVTKSCSLQQAAINSLMVFTAVHEEVLGHYHVRQQAVYITKSFEIS